MEKKETRLDQYHETVMAPEEQEAFVVLQLRPLYERMMDVHFKDPGELVGHNGAGFKHYEERGDEAIVYEFSASKSEYTGQLYYTVAYETETDDRESIVKTMYTIGDQDYIMTKRRTYLNRIKQNGVTRVSHLTYGVQDDVPVQDYEHMTEREKDILFELGNDISSVDRSDYRLASALLEKIQREL